MKLVIAGGVAAGASAAARARRVDDTAEILILERGPCVSFANCGLPYHIGGEIPDRDDLILVTPELFQKRFHIEVRLRHEVAAIHPDRKTVTVRTDSGEYEESYDNLVLATGCDPAIPPIEGSTLKHIHTVCTIPDADGIVSAIRDGVKHAVVVGGGFIGVETAEALLRRSIPTVLVEMQPQLMTNFDPEFSPPMERHLRDAGLEIRLNTGIKAFRGDGAVSSVELSDGTTIPADLVILSAGMRPNTALAADAGLRIGPTGGIAVNEYMQTSDPAIYAAGDAAESWHRVSGQPVRVSLAANANRQGRVAGDHAAGGGKAYHGTLATSVIRVCDITAARTGLTEREAAQAGKSCFSVFIPSTSKAGYFPGAGWLILKLTIEKDTGRILGAQAIGDIGVDKRINVLATAIYAGLTADDLENLDLAYAPPYDGPKGPEIMGGMAAGNVLDGAVRIITPRELPDFLRETGAELIDIRTPGEVQAEGTIEGSRLIPMDDLRARPELLEKNGKYVLFCAVGKRGYNACRFLSQQGYEVYNLTGGFSAYSMDV